MIRVVFSCGGCDAEAFGTAPLTRRFESVSGRDHGIGRYVPANTVQDVTPPGWVAYDMIGATYCPTCWTEIEKGGET